MARLTYRQIQNLPSRDFVFRRSRTYPIPDKAHARNALARVSRYGTPYQKKKVCEAVAKKFPSIHEHSCSMHYHRMRA